jgi:hypothetical protein
VRWTTKTIKLPRIKPVAIQTHGEMSVSVIGGFGAVVAVGLVVASGLAGAVTSTPAFEVATGD